MVFINNLSLKAKFTLLFGVSLLALITLGATSLMSSKKLDDSTTTLYNKNYIPSLQIAQINDLMRSNLQQIILAAYHDPKLDVSKEHEKTHSVDKHLQEIQSNKNKITQIWNDYIKEDLTHDKKKLSQEYVILRKEFVQNGLLKAIELFKEQKYNEAQFFIGSHILPSFNKAKAKSEEILKLQNELALSRMAEAEATYSNIKTSLILVILFSLLLLAFIGTLTAKNITHSLNTIEQNLSYFFNLLGRNNNNNNNNNKLIELNSKDEFGDISKKINENITAIVKTVEQDKNIIKEINQIIKLLEFGFLSVRINSAAGTPELESVRQNFNQALCEMEKASKVVFDVLTKLGTSDYTTVVESGRYSGEIGGIITGLQSLVDNTGDFLALIGKNGNNLNSGATALAQASSDLSHSSNTQATSLEETAAAIEELTSNIETNSQKATQMATIANDTQKAAHEGKTFADNTVKAMNEISKATQAINEAVGIIENIAFQTNILSLNAAVEAASAGDAGKGFAVVAQEVRNLANRSAESAKEIKGLAELANQKSQEGLSVSHDMIKGFDTINQKILQTTKLVQDVTDGSREQTAGINQINIAVTQLDQLTQNNASLANEVNGLSRDILNMAQTLTDTASRTKYKQESEHRVCRIDMMFETNKLKFDHVNFKNNNFAKLKDTKVAWTVVNETQCALGKWIAAHSHEAYAKGSEWNHLLKHHIHVHQKTQEYINKEKAGTSSDELVKIAKEIEADTVEVFNGLNSIRAKACLEL